MTPALKTLFPSDGWYVVWAGNDGKPYRERLVGWGLTHQGALIGVTTGDDETTMLRWADDMASFLGYMEPDTDRHDLFDWYSEDAEKWAKNNPVETEE